MPPLDTSSPATAPSPLALNDFWYIAGLDLDSIRVAVGGSAHIDVGGNAVLETDSGLIDELLIYANNGDEFILDATMARITASDGLNELSVISVDDVAIGTVQSGIEFGALDIVFNLEATTERVGALLHALTYKVVLPGPDLIEEKPIQIYVFAGEQWGYADVYVTVAPPEALVLTRGVDVVTGTDNADVIHVSPFSASEGDQVNGGLGNDTIC